MEVVFLVNLSLDLAINTQTDHIGITFASNCGGIRVNKRESFFECCDTLACGFLLFLNGVFEVARQGFDFLDLLSQIRPQTTQLVNDFILNIPSFVGFCDRLLMKVSQDPIRIIESALGKEYGRRIRIVNDVGNL